MKGQIVRQWTNSNLVHNSINFVPNGQSFDVYVVDNAGVARKFDVNASMSADIQRLTETINTKDVTVEGSGLVYTIKQGGATKATINIPKDTFAKEFTYDRARKELKIKVADADGGSAKEVKVSVADLVNIYTAGTGLQLNANAFSVTPQIAAVPGKVTDLETKVASLEGRVSATNKTDVETLETKVAALDANIGTWT